jgi:hypothetical protein
VRTSGKASGLARTCVYYDYKLCPHSRQSILELAASFGILAPIPDHFFCHNLLTRMDPVPVEAVFGFLGSNAVFRGSDAVCVNATFHCTDPLPPCRSLLGFDFPSLWEITKNYHGKCHQGLWLIAFATIATMALTNKAAEAIAGAMYTRYSTGDIWYVSIGESFFTAFSVSN